MSFARRDLHAGQNVKTVFPFCQQFLRRARAVEHVVIRYRNQIQIGMLFDVFKNFRDGRHAVAVFAVDM